MNVEKLKKYHGSINFNVLNNSHTQAFIFLQEHCQEIGVPTPRVLEVGCSGGYFSEALRAHGMYVYAIEPFSTEAKDAGRVNDFFHGTVEDFCTANIFELYQTFDAVILGDVLEHLDNPKLILIALSRFLKNDGVFIASVPNVTHIGIQRMLEDRQWGYQKYGILDSTHIRFFSWRTLRNMFIEVGFGLERRFDVLIPEFRVYPSINSLNEMMFNTKLNSVDHTFQYVVRASRKALPQEAYSGSVPRNILLISPNPRSSVTILRLIKPIAEYLAAFGGGLKAIKSIECNIDFLHWADVLILHREINIYTLELFRLARKMEIPIIYDTDDLLTKLPDWSINKFSPVDLALMENVIATADRVTCSTQPLKAELLKLSESVHVVPNVFIAQGHLSSPSEKHYSSDCTLVIASSDTVLVDFLLLPVRTLCKAVPSLKVVVIGNIAHYFSNVSPNLSLYDVCSEDSFTKILNTIDNGIGLIPLDDSLFSSCKSPIKYYHYTACGIVSVASAVKPYIECVVDGKNGILTENTLDSWCNSVANLINDYNSRRFLLANAIQTLQKKGSSIVAVKGWENAFTGLPKRTEQVAWKI